MTEIDYVAQPTRTTLDVLHTIFSDSEPQAMNVAAAYITDWGLFDLMGELRKTPQFCKGHVKAQWLTSFDYYRTQPFALKQLSSLKNSEVRIHDADFCLDHGCMPRTPFHPKLYLVFGKKRKYALAGSGNLSRSGLSKGFEAGLKVSNENDAAPNSGSASIEALETWYSELWGNAASLTDARIGAYEEQYDLNLSKPTLTEDDLASGDTSNDALSSEALQRLRTANNFWLQTKTVTKNRGPNKSGNQLMLKRMSRVFFGFSPTDLPRNSPVGEIGLSYKGHSDSYSMTFSDNGMDKLVLPIPDDGGPSSYDNCIIRFSRVGLRQFEVSLGSVNEYKQWKRASEMIGGSFAMKSGREFGVF